MLIALFLFIKLIFLGQKSKKWKNYYFVLDSNEQHLYYYENDRRTRPKGLVDLNYTFFYLVHDTLFERPNCFQLVERPLPCMSTVYYMCSPSYDILQVILSLSSITIFCKQLIIITVSNFLSLLLNITINRNGFKPLDHFVFNN